MFRVLELVEKWDYASLFIFDFSFCRESGKNFTMDVTNKLGDETYPVAASKKILLLVYFWMLGGRKDGED